MGGQSSIPVHTEDREELLDKFLKKESPLQWTPEQVVEWLKLNNSDEALIAIVSDLLLDGECLSETPIDVLLKWIEQNQNGIAQSAQIKKLVCEQLRSHDMVVAFQSTDETTLNYDEHRCEISGDAITEQTATAAINKFHSYTKNTSTGGAPTVKRLWAYQPKISRRYYGCDIQKLVPRCQEARIDQILYYSMSVSAYQNADQRIMWPRCVSSKRVNPSSGGLHPVETYVIQCKDSRTTVGHYMPFYHALENRFTVEKDIIPERSIIIGLSTVLWREVWKYGPRGWRYTQLDVGHAIGSIVLACKLSGYEVKVIDAIMVPNADKILGLQQIVEKSQKLEDPRESEHAVAFLLLTPQNKDFEIVSKDLKTLQEALQLFPNEISNLCGEPNVVFNRARDPVIWPFIDVIERSTRFINEASCEEVPRMKVLSPLRLFDDNAVLRDAIRMRRSVLNFKQECITQKQLASCLCSTLAEFNSLVSLHCQNFFGKGAARCYENIQFGLWITGVKLMKNGLYYLLRGESEEFLANLRDHFATTGSPALERQHIPGFGEMKLYYCPTNEQGLEMKEVRKEASTNSCHQKIAEDCSVVVSMFAPVDQSIQKQSRNYMYMHWEAGFLGQLLYIQSYQQGLGATGMGCFLDDESAAIFNVSPQYKPLYHFAFGSKETDHRFSTLK